MKGFEWLTLLIPITVMAVVLFMFLRDRPIQGKRKSGGSSTDSGFIIAGADSASVSHSVGGDCSVSDSGGDCGGGDSGGGSD